MLSTKHGKSLLLAHSPSQLVLLYLVVTRVPPPKHQSPNQLPIRPAPPQPLPLFWVILPIMSTLLISYSLFLLWMVRWRVRRRVNTWNPPLGR